MINHCLQLWAHLAPMHRLGAIALTLGNLLTSVLEVLGIALFGAVMLRLTQQGGSSSGPSLAAVMGHLGDADLPMLTLLCGIVYVGKNACMFALSWLDVAAASSGSVADTDAVNVVTARLLATAGWHEAPRLDRPGVQAGRLAASDFDLRTPA